MFSNPFAELSATIPPAIMQSYVVVMALLVLGGTLFDIWHKKSATYFFANWRAARAAAKTKVGPVGLVAAAVQTAAVDVAASGEFCNPRRRIAHLLTMWGFIIYLVATAALVFAYPTPLSPAPAGLVALWYLGALMVCGGGYWFWFFIRVDVAAEGHSPFRLVRADLFVVSLVLSTTFAIVWALVQAAGGAGAAAVFLVLYLVATTVLFGAIPWSKFSHMFFKPAAAFEKRISEANGTRSNLPPPADAAEQFGSVVKTVQNY